MSVHTKLMEARIKLQNSELKKTGENKFAGYKYFELGDFLPTVQKIFAELKLCGVVSFAPDIATLTITDTDDGSTMAITSPMSSAALKGCHEVQNLGAVQTYIRRYLWVAAMEIVEHDALDATTGKADPEKKESAKSVARSVWDTLPAEQQNFLTGIAMEIIGAINANNMAEAYRLFYQNHLDADEQTALWSRLDSKQRSAVKSYKESIERKAE
jgi:hypothetical protein